jgi:CRP-like cAMP-binding protein
MLSESERMSALRRGRAFGGLDDAALVGLRACLRWRELGTGETLYRQGDCGDALAIVASGMLAATITLQRGGQYELGRIAPGSIVGEMVCVDPAPRSATVTAMEPTVIAELGRDALTALRNGAPKVYAAIMRAVIQVVGLRLRELDYRIDAELGGGTATDSGTAPGLAAGAKKRSASPLSVAQAPAKKRDGFLGLIDRILGTS